MNAAVFANYCPIGSCVVFGHRTLWVRGSWSQIQSCRAENHWDCFFWATSLTLFRRLIKKKKTAPHFTLFTKHPLGVFRWNPFTFLFLAGRWKINNPWAREDWHVVAVREEPWPRRKVLKSVVQERLQGEVRGEGCLPESVQSVFDLLGSCVMSESWRGIFVAPEEVS